MISIKKKKQAYKIVMFKPQIKNDNVFLNKANNQDII